VATLGLPDSLGVPPGFTNETLIAGYNDAESVRRLFERYGGQIAAVIVEPVCGNMGVIVPAPGFLNFLEDITRRFGAVLIFDEVITGFRLALGGAQQIYGVQPDLTCLGKILGGGLPLAAFGGRRPIMNLLAPEGPVYQAGTLSGNPVAVAAGLAALRELRRKGVYERLENKSATLHQGFVSVLEKYKTKAAINRVGSMMTLFFGVADVRDATEARSCDQQNFRQFFHGMLKRGIYWPPSPFEAAFVSLDLKRTIAAFADWAAGELRN
jgi:glutamate-1-semialdehyde 2,1-aminomutase